MYFHYRQRRLKVTPILFTLLILCTILLAACGGDNPAANHSQKKQVMAVAGQDAPFSLAGFNPFASANNAGILGFVYEPLEFCNINDGSYSPLLAIDHAWSKDLTQITFHLRQNVQWNDGQPFNADDVLFSFNAIKQYPAADIANAWSYLKDVASPDSNTIVLTLQKPFVPALFNLATRVPIIPKHIFASVGDVTRYNSDKVVGTGPFKVDHFTPDLMVLTKNPTFWQKDSIKVDEIRMPHYNGNESFETVMPTGTIDWSGYFDVNLQTSYVDKDPTHNKYFMDAIGQVDIFPDLRNPLLGQLAIRKAISYGIDREAIAHQAAADQEPPATQHGLTLPASQAYLDPTYANLPTKAAADQAEQFLKDAGFIKGADGIYATKDGQRLSFELISVIGFTDWNALAQVVQQNLKTIGIEIKIMQMPPSAYSAFRASPKPYQLMISNVSGGPSPYVILNNTLNSNSLAPKGRNLSFWKDNTTDQLLQQFATSSDKDVQIKAIQGLEKIMVEQVPYIPMLGGAQWCEYTTTRFSGWPTAQNPYSSCAPYAWPANEFVLMHVQPVS